MKHNVIDELGEDYITEFGIGEDLPLFCCASPDPRERMHFARQALRTLAEEVDSMRSSLQKRKAVAHVALGQALLASGRA